jgi:hypothetical protein
MPQKQVAPFSRLDLDESRSLQLADHLGPSHRAIVNLALGYIEAGVSTSRSSVGMSSSLPWRRDPWPGRQPGHDGAGGT